MATYAQAVIAAYCQREASCCEGEGGGVTGFQTSACEADFLEGELVPNTNLGLLFAAPNSPNVTLDVATALQCIAAMGAMGCHNDLKGDYQNLYDLCSSALIPGLIAGQTGCETQFDCPPTTYCGPLTGVDSNSVPQVDPNPANNTCLSFGGEGSSCLDTGYATDCQYLGQTSATGQLYCDGSGTCQPAQDNGSTCATGQTEQCKSGLCIDFQLVPHNFLCEGAAPFENYEDYSVCATYDIGG